MRCLSRILLIAGLVIPAFLAGQACLCHAEEKLPDGARADRIVVRKKDRILSLLDRGRVLKTYKVALGGDPVGPKTKNGDHKTPEGIYVLDRRNEHSHYYRSLHISYPNAEDRARAAKAGAEPGGDIMVHGRRTGWVGSVANVAFRTEPTDVSRSQMKRWMRSGELCLMEP